MPRTAPASLLLVLTSLACTPSAGDDDIADESSDTTSESDTSESDASESDTSESDASESGTSDTSESDTSESDTSDTSESDTAEDPFDFPPVECDGMICAQGQICVKQGTNCDYRQDPPMFYTPPSTCIEVPIECLDATEATVDNCLGPLVCLAPGWDLSDWTYVEGTLQCPDPAADCY